MYAWFCFYGGFNYQKNAKIWKKIVTSSYHFHCKYLSLTVAECWGKTPGFHRAPLSVQSALQRFRWAERWGCQKTMLPWGTWRRSRSEYNKRSQFCSVCCHRRNPRHSKQDLTSSKRFAAEMSPAFATSGRKRTPRLGWTSKPRTSTKHSTATEQVLDNGQIPIRVASLNAQREVAHRSQQ